MLNKTNNGADAIDPYYKKLIYSVTCNELIDQGYLTPIQVGAVAEHYSTENLKIDTKNESFTTKSLNEMLSAGGVTERIVQDFLAKTKDKKGVMIFCTSIKHAEDVYSMLPSGDAVILHGKKLSKAELSKAMGKTKSYINVMSSESQLKKIGDITPEQLDGIKFKIDSIDAPVPDSVISIKKPPNILSRDDVLQVLREKLNYSHAQYVGDHIILTDDKL